MGPAPRGSAMIRKGEPGLVAASAEVGSVCDGGRVGEQPVDLPDGVSLEAADDLFVAAAFGPSSFEVGLGGLVVAEADHDHAPQRMVGFPIASPVEPVTDSAAGGRLDRAGPAVGRKGCLGAHPVGVVAGRHDQGGGGVGP
jgi:hypothetical protein